MVTLSKSLSQAMKEELRVEMKSMENRLESRLVKNVTKAISSRDPTVHPVDFSSMREVYETESSDGEGDNRGDRGDERSPPETHARNDDLPGQHPSSARYYDMYDGNSQDVRRAPFRDANAPHVQSEFPPMSRARSRNHRPSNTRYNEADNNASRKIIDVLKKYEDRGFCSATRRRSMSTTGSAPLKPGTEDEWETLTIPTDNMGKPLCASYCWPFKTTPPSVSGAEVVYAESLEHTTLSCMTSLRRS
jgi:hypothetical protein